MAGETATPPPVLWAQRKEDVFLTFSVESANPTLRIESDTVYFKGVSAQDNRPHELTIELYAPVVPADSTTLNKGRCIELTLRKENKEASYWPSLTKDKRKPHWLKVDFNRWKDEDESGDEATGGSGNGNVNIEEMLASMGGGAGGLGLGGAGGDGKPSFDDLEGDSDDEDLPDLE